MSAEALTHIVSSNEKRIISIASGKGGVGKTFIAISLAHALSRLGKKVLLFDGDLGLANVDIQLGLNPDADVGDIFSGTTDVQKIIRHYADGTLQGSGFDIIAGRSGSGALANLTRDKLLALRKAIILLGSYYDHVVMDLGAGIELSVSTLADHRGTCIVVLTPDPTALTDAYAFIKLRTQRNPHLPVQVIINGVASRPEGLATFEGLAKVCSSFIGITPSLLGIVHHDKKISDCIRNQKPLLTRHVNSVPALDIQKIADTLAIM
jgi:flagellar biosynthesis protein FlhG